MSIMLHSVSMDTKEPVLLGANPKVTVAVEHHGGNGEFASVEGGGHERPNHAIPQLPKPSWTFAEYAHPQRSVGSTWEIGIPSDFPKHLTARSVTWQRGGSDLCATHKEPSGSSLMR